MSIQSLVSLVSSPIERHMRSLWNVSLKWGRIRTKILARFPGNHIWYLYNITWFVLHTEHHLRAWKIKLFNDPKWILSSFQYIRTWIFLKFGDRLSRSYQEQFSCCMYGARFTNRIQIFEKYLDFFSQIDICCQREGGFDFSASFSAPYN